MAKGITGSHYLPSASGRCGSQSVAGYQISKIQLLTAGRSRDVPKPKEHQNPSLNPETGSPHCVFRLLKHASLKNSAAKTFITEKGHSGLVRGCTCGEMGLKSDKAELKTQEVLRSVPPTRAIAVDLATPLRWASSLVVMGVEEECAAMGLSEELRYGQGRSSGSTGRRGSLQHASPSRALPFASAWLQLLSTAWPSLLQLSPTYPLGIFVTGRS